ncbi:MAG: aminotransferase class I/II-fold pyridoxal phosphate-dependent enzyme [Anaerolineae bacterium]
MPGLRIGYLRAPPPLQERVATMKQAIDISSSALNQRALHVYLSGNHFPAHLEKIRQSYKIRRDAMLAAAQRYFPPSAQWREPDGGLYLWVTMAAGGPKATELYVRAVEYGVAFAIGSVFFSHNPSPYTIRLNFAFQPPGQIEEGMRRLGKAWRELQIESRRPEKPRPQPAMPIL